MDFKKIYTPNQIFISSVLFGPFASAYCLDKNFKTLNVDKKGISPLLYLLSFIITVALCFVPSGKIFIHLTYSYLAYSIADRKQVSQKEMKNSDSYKAHSILNLIVVSLVALAVLTVVVFVSVFSVTLLKNNF
ncbi:MAG: hypothetical protein ACJAUJ_001811 [Salibacteraceae bacterium]|jgi:hypothetical protein